MMISIIMFLSTVNFVYAQPLQSPDDQMRTSVVVPNLSDTDNGWQKVGEKEIIFFDVEYRGHNMVIEGSQTYYVNQKESKVAYLYSKRDVNGDKEDFSMLYGTINVARAAIKVGGKWYASRDLYFDNGKQNLNGWVSTEVIYDEHEADKPVKVRFTLESVDGRKEITLNLTLN